MIAENGARDGLADIFLCVTDWLPEAIRGGMITCLDPFLAQNPPEDWPEGWSPSMLGLQKDAAGQTFGLPYHDGPEIFMYRRDLFESPDQQEQFLHRFGRPLRPPQDWDEFVEVAKFFTQPDRGLWGTCLAGFPDAHNNVYDFMIHLWSRGGSLLEDRRAAFDTEAGIEAIEFLRSLYHVHQVVDLECLELGSIQSGLYYASGRAAMMWNWSGFAAIAEDASNSKIAGKNAVCAMPSGLGPKGRSVSLNIYWVLTIPSGSRHKDLVYEFIRHCCGPAMDKATSILGGNGTRLSTWQDEEVREKFPYYRIIESVHQSVESPPNIPEFPEIAEVLSQMVDNVLRSRASSHDSLRIASDKVNQILMR